MYSSSAADKRLTIILFLLPAVVGLLVFCMLPMFASIIYSMLDYDILKPMDQIRFVGFDNFQKIIKGKELYETGSHTLKYVALYVPAVMIAALFQALLINRSFRGRAVYRTIFYTPVITSWVAAAVVWKWLLNGKVGLFNQALLIFNIQGPNWLNDRNWAMVGIVIAAIWKDAGYFALMIYAALKSIDISYFEAAAIDGAGPVRRLFNITLPLISPTIFLLLVTNVIGSLQVFESVFIMTGGGPANATTVFLERIYRYAFKLYKLGVASAFSWILFILILVFTLFQFVLQKRWVNYDA